MVVVCNVEQIEAGEEEDAQEEEEEDDEEALQMALQMSMAEAAGVGGAVDADFVNQLLGSVGVDQNDPLMQAALEQLGASGGNAAGGEDEKRPNPNGDGKDDGEDGNDSKKRRDE